MGLFILTYDIHKAGEGDYERVEKVLRQVGAKRVLLSAWAIRGSYTTKALFEYVAPHLKPVDRLLVIESGDGTVYCSGKTLIEPLP